MYYTLSEVNIEHKPVLLQSTPKGFFVIDEQKNIYRLDISRYYTLGLDMKWEEGGKTLSKNLLALSANLHLAAVDTGSFALIIYHIEMPEVTQICLLNWHKIDISVLCYSDSGEYLASGDDEGNIFLYRTANYTLCAAPPKARGRICKVAFSKNERFLVYADSVGGVYLFDLFLKQEVWACNNRHLELPLALFFADRGAIYVFYKSGKLFMYHIESQTQKELASFIRKGIAATYLEAEKTLLAATDEGAVFGIHLGEEALDKRAVAIIDGILDFRVDGRFLVCSLAEPAVRVVDIYKYMTEVDMNYEVKNYQKVQEYFEKNSFLGSIVTVRERLLKAWKECVKEAVKQIHDNNILRAHKICVPFFGDSKRVDEFNEYKNFSKELRHFYRMVKEKKIDEAYRMVHNYSFLKNTTKYQELEKHWQNSFSTAKKLLLKEQNKYVSICEKLLAPFMFDLQKKEICTLLLKQPDLFARIDNAIKHSNFKLFFAIVEKNGVLTKSEIYNKVIQYAKEKIAESRALINRGEYEKASEKIRELLGTTPYKDELNDIQKEIEILKSANEAKKRGSTKELLLLLCRNHFLHDKEMMDDVKELIKKEFESAMEKALKGDARGAYGVLCRYFDIEPLHPKIAFVMRVGYVNELISSKAKNLPIDWEITVSRYLERFGDDMLIRRFLEHFKAQKLLVALDGVIDAEGYKKVGFLESVCILKQKKVK